MHVGNDLHIGEHVRFQSAVAFGTSVRTLTVRVSGSTTLYTRMTLPEKLDPGNAGTETLTSWPPLTRSRSFSNTFASIQTREMSMILNRFASEPTVAPMVALRSTTIPEIGELREKTAARLGLFASASMSESFRPSISRWRRAAVSAAFAPATELSADAFATSRSCSAD